MGAMNVLGREGDWKLEWDPKNKLEVEQVRKTFEHNVRDKGFAAFRIDEKGKRREQIHSFEPEAERIVLVPPITGG
ncbi:MAG: hypothetical protein ACRDHG_07150 [Anaerolineales bacterium]